MVTGFPGRVSGSRWNSCTALSRAGGRLESDDESEIIELRPPRRYSRRPPLLYYCYFGGVVWQMFEGTVESAKEHKPPRVMPQLMEYFKAIKVICVTPCDKT